MLTVAKNPIGYYNKFLHKIPKYIKSIKPLEVSKNKAKTKAVNIVYV